MTKFVVHCDGVNWKEDFPVITAKTNSGKTTFAVEEMRAFVESEIGYSIDKVILLTPYKRTKRQILKREKFSGMVRELDSTQWDNVLSKRTDEVMVSTYAGLCLQLELGNLTLDDCLLIFDEVHTFVEFTAYQPQMGYLLEWLENPEQWSKFIAVGMSGTPQILFDYVNRLSESPYKFIDITPQSKPNITCGKGLFIKGGSIQSYAELLIEQGFKGAKLFYVDSAKVCYDLACIFNDAGYQSAYIVSEYHDKHKDSNGLILGEAMKNQAFDGLSILDWVDEYNDVPQSIDILVINASAKDGINVLDTSLRFDEVVIESTNRATIEQARSRIRHDLDKLTIIYSKKNEYRAKLNLTDALGFLKDYEGRATTETLYKRLEEQRTNDKLNWIVARGKIAFLNPFIVPLCAYHLDNYEFSEKSVYYDDEGNEIEETITISRLGKALPTFYEWLQKLKPIIGGKSFEIVNGDKINEQVRNLKAEREFDITPYLNRKLFTQDKEQLAIALGLIDRNRHPKAWTTVKKWLESKGYIVESKGSKALNPHTDKRQTYSIVKWPEKLSAI